MPTVILYRCRRDRRGWMPTVILYRCRRGLRDWTLTAIHYRRDPRGRMGEGIDRMGQDLPDMMGIAGLTGRTAEPGPQGRMVRGLPGPTATDPTDRTEQGLPGPMGLGRQDRTGNGSPGMADMTTDPQETRTAADIAVPDKEGPMREADSSVPERREPPEDARGREPHTINPGRKPPFKRLTRMNVCKTLKPRRHTRKSGR
jgi:hypothetical protein